MREWHGENYRHASWPGSGYGRFTNYISQPNQCNPACPKVLELWFLGSMINFCNIFHNIWVIIPSRISWLDHCCYNLISPISVMIKQVNRLVVYVYLFYRFTCLTCWIIRPSHSQVQETGASPSVPCTGTGLTGTTMKAPRGGWLLMCQPSAIYPLVNKQFAIENCHRNSGFTQL